MKLVTLDSIIEYVMPEVVGCPRDLIIREIKESAINFCAATAIWRYDLDPVNLLAGVSAYCIDIPRDSNIVDIKSLNIGGRPIDPQTAEWLDENSDRWRTQEGTANYYVVESPGDIRLSLIPVASTDETMTGVVTLKPKRVDPKIPQFIIDDWMDTIAAGAKSRLMLMPNKKWSNPQDGILQADNNDIGKSKAGASAYKGHSNVNLRVAKRRIV